MSVLSSCSSIFGVAMAAAPPQIERRGNGVIVCSSRPQKKATAHHRKSRPRKSQPWDINRKPTVYAPLPPLPSDWTLVVSAADASSDEAVAVTPSA